MGPANTGFHQLRFTSNLIHVKTSLCQLGKIIIWPKKLKIQSVLIAMHAFSFGCQNNVFRKDVTSWVKM